MGADISTSLLSKAGKAASQCYYVITPVFRTSRKTQDYKGVDKS